MEKDEVIKRLKEKGLGKTKSTWYKKAKERQRKREYQKQLDNVEYLTLKQIKKSHETDSY